ncbi:phospholipase D-like domain-containing protein [Neobacillus dielmonensis]|uniref:phospholipase D-like domain-containing protein n=1 Tax=Neobacillus dielmonensis TaxID=1347369 RepID=UPI0006947063|nr:phospholipase D-like domain-containing protein [Neobacillus dielmonensis]
MSKKIGTIVLLLSLVINLVFLGIIIKDSTQEDSGGTQLSYSITGYQGDPEKDLVHVINNTKSELNIAIYNLDNEQIADAIYAAAERGVSIRIIADGENTENKDSRKIFKEFEKLNIPIKISTDEKMHVKLTISDNQTVVTGSFNYTKDSAEENQENLVTVKDSDLASSMNDTFNQLWNSNDLEDW